MEWIILAQTNLICVRIERNYIGNKLSLLVLCSVIFHPIQIVLIKQSFLNTKLKVQNNCYRC